MTIRLFLILQIILYHMTAAAVYNYNETSEVIHFNEYYLSGFRDVTEKDFILGGLFPVLDCTNYTYIDVELLEAMLFAIDRINNDINLLPSLTIGYDVRDTCNHEIPGFNEALDIRRRSRYNNTLLLGIIGPAADSVALPIANLFGLYRIPIVSYASSSATLSNKNLYKYFLRTVPSSNLQANAMVDLVSHYGWHYVSVIFSDDYEYGQPGSNTFIDAAIKHSIYVDVKIGIPPLEASKNNFNKTIEKAVKTLLNSKASVVVVFADELTVLALFSELKKTNSTSKFVWIASDRWVNSVSVRNRFPEIAKGTLGFRLHTKHVEEFVDYFSQLTPWINIRNPFFRERIYLKTYCTYVNRRGYYCPPNALMSHRDTVPLVIEAVYVFAHAIQNFLDNNCDNPFRWNHAIQQCDGMKYNLTARNLLGYIFNVTFNGIQNRNVSFDENGDPSGVYEIIHLQTGRNGQIIDISVGFWNSFYKENALILTNTDGIEKIFSRCSDPCSKGMVRSITIPNCPSCFECVPCVGPTYSMNSSAINCSLCSDNHWGSNPLSGSTYCVPVKVTHLDFSNGWSIVSICIATVVLIILAIITVLMGIYWKTPVVKSSGREEMVMLLIGIGVCCVLTYIVVAPPSTAVCIFQRIGVWLCFALAFGALLVKIIRVARIFYSIKSSAKRPPFTGSKYQVIFTMVIVAGQLILVVIGLGVDPPVVKRDPDVVRTNSVQQSGNAPEIIETCQQPHTALLVLLLVYNFAIILGCTILGWMTRKFPENFNEARHVTFTSFTLMVVWVLFGPLYFSTEHEFQTGVLALGIVLSAIALLAGVFFPRVFTIIFQKHKNTKDYVSQQNHAGATDTTQSTNFSKAFQRSKILKFTV